MKRSSKKLPKDTNQLATEIVRLSTEEPVQTETVTAYLSAIGTKGGLRGGNARAKKLSPERRKAIAQNAANARWKVDRKKSLPQ